MVAMSANVCNNLNDGHCPLLDRIEEMEKEYILQIEQQALLLEQQAHQIASLNAKIAELEKKLVDSNDDGPSPPPSFVKSNRNKAKRRRKAGRKKGHQGSGRKRPDHITETMERYLPVCPCCGESLGGEDIISTHDHVQEDIIPAQVKVTLYRHRRYRCPGCGEQSNTVVEGDEIPKARLGPRVLLTAALYKYNFGLPFRKIARMFVDTCGLKVSHGALQQGVERLAEMMTGEFESILQAIRAGPDVHVDETGWRVDGVNHWLWTFVNRQYTLYQIHRGRSSKIPLNVLGNNYDGVVISDFYSAYNPLPYKKQKCFVHLLRELHEIGEKNSSQEFRAFKKKLTRLLDDSVRLAEGRNTLSTVEFARRRKLLKTRLQKLAVETRTDKDTERIRKRLLKHEKELLLFLDHPGVEKDNNRAERAIRPNVLIRKISGGNRSDAGADTHNILMSLIETTTQQGKDWFTEGKKIVQNYRDDSSQTVFA